jgi:hypothetical protein
VVSKYCEKSNRPHFSSNQRKGGENMRIEEIKGELNSAGLSELPSAIGGFVDPDAMNCGVCCDPGGVY